MFHRRERYASASLGNRYIVKPSSKIVSLRRYICPTLPSNAFFHWVNPEVYGSECTGWAHETDTGIHKLGTYKSIKVGLVTILVASYQLVKGLQTQVFFILQDSLACSIISIFFSELSTYLSPPLWISPWGPGPQLNIPSFVSSQNVSHNSSRLSLQIFEVTFLFTELSLTGLNLHPESMAYLPL